MAQVRLRHGGWAEDKNRGQDSWHGTPVMVLRGSAHTTHADSQPAGRTNSGILDLVILSLLERLKRPMRMGAHGPGWPRTARSRRSRASRLRGMVIGAP